MWTARSSRPPPVAAIWSLSVTVPTPANVNDWPTVGCAGRAKDAPSTVSTGLMRFALAVTVLEELQVEGDLAGNQADRMPAARDLGIDRGDPRVRGHGTGRVERQAGAEQPADIDVAQEYQGRPGGRGEALWGGGGEPGLALRRHRRSCRRSSGGRRQAPQPAWRRRPRGPATRAAAVTLVSSRFMNAPPLASRRQRYMTFSKIRLTESHAGRRRRAQARSHTPNASLLRAAPLATAPSVHR